MKLSLSNFAIARFDCSSCHVVHPLSVDTETNGSANVCVLHYTQTVIKYIWEMKNEECCVFWTHMRTEWRRYSLQQVYAEQWIVIATWWRHLMPRMMCTRFSTCSTMWSLFPALSPSNTMTRQSFASQQTWLCFMHFWAMLWCGRFSSAKCSYVSLRLII